MSKNSSKPFAHQEKYLTYSLKNVSEMSIKELFNELLLIKFPNIKKRPPRERAILKFHLERWIKSF